jgi:DNA-binding CsgD family transcriptional regulator
LHGPTNCPLNAGDEDIGELRPQLSALSRKKQNDMMSVSTNSMAGHPMSLDDRTERALEACYDAVLMPALWPEVLQQLADALAVTSCNFTPLDGIRPPGLPVSTGHCEFAALWCQNQEHAPCPFTGKPLPFADNYVIDDQVLKPDDRKTLAYFHETAGPGNREWWAAGSFAVADRQWLLSVYRDPTRGRFSHREGRYLAQVAPHFGRTMALAAKLETEKVSSALAALDQMNCPALVIDWRGAVRNVNRLAESLSEEGLHLHRGRLWTSDLASNRRIQELIAAILATAPGSNPPLNQVVVNRADGPWLLIEAMPVTALASDVFNEGRALLLLTDLTKPAVSDSKLLATIFGLTPAEAKLAACIASGNGIDAAAAALRIGRETVKSQLKAVFLKTSTRSQLELVALLGRLRSTNGA